MRKATSTEGDLQEVYKSGIIESNRNRYEVPFLKLPPFEKIGSRNLLDTIRANTY